MREPEEPTFPVLYPSRLKLKVDEGVVLKLILRLRVAVVAIYSQS